MRPLLLWSVVLFTLINPRCTALGANDPVAPPPSSQPSTWDPLTWRGTCTIAFEEQSPLSPIELQMERQAILPKPSQLYRLTDETFELYVPEDYDPSRAYGILVWMNCENDGTIPQEWHSLLAKYKLIGIAPNNTGYGRGRGVRQGLALDAVYNLKKLYKIDAARIYVAGISTGGGDATMLPVLYPDVFSGALAIGDASYYREVFLPNSSPGRYKERTTLGAQFFPMGQARAGIERTKQVARFALFSSYAGSTVSKMYELGFKKDGFRYVDNLVVPIPMLGLPSNEWVDRAFRWIDAPIAQIAKAELPPLFPSPTTAPAALAKLQRVPTTMPSVGVDVRRGSFQDTLTERSPLSGIPAQMKRDQIEAPAPKTKLADSEMRSIDVYVPNDYRPHVKYGLMVWINESEDGALREEWREVLDRKHIIGVGLNDCGDDRDVRHRIGMALDAVHNTKRRYDIENTRVYVAGFRGGGEVASMLGIIYPDVFHGAVCYGRAAYFWPPENQPARVKAIRPMFRRPLKPVLYRPWRTGSFVLISEWTDPDFKHLRDIYEQGFRHDGFKHVYFIQDLKGKCRTPLDATWFGVGFTVDDYRTESAVLTADLPPISGLDFGTFKRRPTSSPSTSPADDDQNEMERLMPSER